MGSKGTGSQVVLDGDEGHCGTIERCNQIRVECPELGAQVHDILGGQSLKEDARSGDAQRKAVHVLTIRA